MESVIKKEDVERLRHYAMAHLAEQFRTFTNAQDDVIEILTHPEQNKSEAGRVAFLRNLAEQDLDYLAELIELLQRTGR